MRNLKEIDQRLLEFKEKSELMVDLAYSSLLYDNKVIAREVDILENELDEEQDRLEKMAMEEVQEGGSIDRALLYVRLTSALEVIADSAREIADVVLRDMDMHPVFQMSVRDSETIISAAIISSRSPVAGQSLKDAELPTEFGMWVIAVKRGKKWFYGPDGDFVVSAGDMVIARGPPENEDEFIAFVGRKVEWDSAD